MSKIASHRIEFDDGQISEITEGVEQILRSGQVILGPQTEAFEREYAAACNRLYGVAVSSDTAAFEILLKILVEKKGPGPVMFPALGFGSLLESLKNAECWPWFIDIPPLDQASGLFADVEMLGAAYDACMQEDKQAPLALILMHTGGLMATYSPEIEQWCRNNEVTLLEDAAHGFGASIDGDPAGSFGLASAFSLYATKPMHSMEGGVIVTNDDEWAKEAKVYRNYGRVADFGRSVIVRHGYSWRMPEISALVGRSNLKRVEDNVARRQEIMRLYDGLWDELELGQIAKPLPQSDRLQANGYRHLYLLPEGATADDRFKLKHELAESHSIDLPGEVYELPAHKQPVWPEYATWQLPNAEDFCARHFSLPVYPSLTDSDCTDVVMAVGGVLRQMYG